MNIASLITGWKWIIGIIFLLSILFWAYGNKRYEAGKTEIYQQIANAPAKSDTIWKVETIPAPPPIIKWLKADTIYTIPESTQTQINQLSNNCDSLKMLLSEKAKPFETEMDSTRFLLQILTHPWERMNEVKIQIKPFSYDYSDVTNTRIIVKEHAWWEYALEIGGSAFIGYEVGRVVK
jgi:hypothetical protein